MKFRNTLFIILGATIVGLIYILLGGPIPHIGQNSAPDEITFTNQNPNDGGIDGLGMPDQTKTYKLDEFGVGVSSIETFNRDINNDGQMDRITRTHHENGTAHGYDEYTLELNRDGKYINITPSGFRTIAGAECMLKKLQFNFRPTFNVVKISRPWVDTWDTPSMATQTIYELDKNELKAFGNRDLQIVCDVATLF